MRTTRRLVLVAVAAAAATALAVPGTALAASGTARAAPGNAARPRTTAAHGSAAGPRTAAASAPASVPANCSSAMHNSVQHPHQTVSCVTIGNGIMAARSNAAAPDPGFPVSCDSKPRDRWYYGRFEMCMENAFGEFLLLDGVKVGFAGWLYAQQFTFSSKSLKWTESDYARLDQVKGIAVANALGWVTDCSGACSPALRALWPITPMVKGETLHGTASFAGTPASGRTGSLTATPIVTIVDPVGRPAALSFPLLTSLDVRCDNGVAVARTAGCVVPRYVPVLSVPQATYGAAAALIRWAQVNLPGHWGLQGSGNPLTRLKNTATRDRNRRIICRDVSWVNLDGAVGGTSGDSDSCDEYPFAATYQSGALHGVTAGLQCAQLIAVLTGVTGNEAADWNTVIPLGQPTRTEACARGHIPLRLNNSVGTAYRALISTQRLIDKDPFWVSAPPS